MSRTPNADKLSHAAPKPPRKPSEVISAQHKVFADTLLEGKSQSEAARAAGYHPNNVRQVIREESVQVYLERARAEITDVSTLKRLDVVNIVLEAIDMARTLADPAQMINGADKLAKIMGYYAPETLQVVDKTEEMSREKLASKMRSMSDEELYALVMKRRGESAQVIDVEPENA